ncbi:MAG: phosphoribosylanthranilate isomerase [Lachnospiraceae bacterium]|nr:phosphoribosylanthranilate isomerase [Lachnospiraceae bacterium]
MKVKICGLTKPEEAEYLNTYGADYAGFVLFFPKSKRNTDIETALCIKEKLDPGIKSVAVTVSPSLEEASAICNAGFDHIQIHGNIPAGYETLSNKIPVIKAFNVSDLASYDALLTDKDICGFVFDAASPGSGKTFDWNMLNDLKRKPGLLYILSGGLTPSNVAEAISVVNPDIVDVSSGVEYDMPTDPVSGVSLFKGKDPAKIQAFIKASGKMLRNCYALS